MCGSDAIEHRKNSWELYGLDFMLDEDFTPWLIEINSSPACDYSTPITERYVKKALVELLDVVLDVREWEMQSKKSRGDKPKTGGWENIYTGPFVETPASSFGTDMTVKGELLKVPKKKTATNVFGVCSPPRVDAPDSNTPSVPVVKSLKPKRTEDARTPAVTKSAMVKFDMDGDSDQDELSNIARKLGNPTGVSNPPTVAARASQLQRGNNIVNSSNLQTPKAEIDPSAVSTQPLSGRVAASSSLKEVDEFPDFDDSDSDGQSQCRLTAKAVDPKNSGRPQVVKCAAKKVQNVPDGVAVIPIKTFSMEL
ncbi:TTLL3C [Symbiodinium microadriaticum]|nr:TTLL3C [Symbiodinium microadriaticum]